MIKNIFLEILARKRKFVAQLRANPSARDFRKRALEIRKNAQPHRMLQALKSDSRRPKIIAEFKRKSPSAGIIRDDLTIGEAVRCYERGGACAISLLTDEEYFAGSIADLLTARSITKLPILRKDFIIDPIQIFEAAAAGADAVLLITAALDDASLAQLRALAEDELGMDALVEVHSSEEMERALNARATIIGVNNRDLRTFQVSVSTSERLITEAPTDKIMVSESGLQSADSLLRLHKLGFHGFLIGEALMRAPKPEIALRDFVDTTEGQQAVKDEIAGRLCQMPWRFTEKPYKHRPVQIKVCGITNLKDARACVQLGVDMIGFNFYPRSRRHIDPNAARRIIDTFPPSVCPVGVFVDAATEEIRSTASAAGVRCVQLHGHMSPHACGELSHEFRIIRAFSTNRQFRPDEVSLFRNCDALVDAHHPILRGGTGMTCDWLAARTAGSFTRFLILSGGLTEQNVGQAIETVAPDAVDVCSGVEKMLGVKNQLALENFVAAVHKATSSLNASTC